MPDSRIGALPLEWVRAFEAAGRTGSFVAAARETGVTQAAISQRIGNLESRLNTRLFVRKARGVSLSVEGEAWLPYVARALDTVEQSAEALFATQSRKLVIAASASVIQTWFVPRLARMPDSPRLQLSFSTLVLQDDAQPARGQVAVRYGSGGWPQARSARLFGEALGPVASPDLITKDTMWQDLPKIGLSGPRADWQAWARDTGDPATPVPDLRFDSLCAGIAAAKAGAGVLLASLPLCSAELEAGHLVRLSDHVMRPDQSYWMIAEHAAISEAQWDMLTDTFCEPANTPDIAGNI